MIWHGRRRARKKRRRAEVKEKFWRKKSEILWEIFKNRSRKRNRHKRKISQEKKNQGNQKICENFPEPEEDLAKEEQEKKNQINEKILAGK